jgi:hypothetical protein
MNRTDIFKHSQILNEWIVGWEGGTLQYGFKAREDAERFATLWNVPIPELV